MDKTAQFNGRGKQLNVRFAPFGGILQIVGIVEDTFQSSESGILAKHRYFISGLRSTPGNIEAKGKPYRLNVVAHGLEAVISHSRPVFQ